MVVMTKLPDGTIRKFDVDLKDVNIEDNLISVNEDGHQYIMSMTNTALVVSQDEIDSFGKRVKP